MKATQSDRPLVPAGTWVELERVILKPGERAPGIPADTASVPFSARVRGFLVTPAHMGTIAEARTQAGRVVTGRLRAVLPRNPADFGDPSPELLQVGKAMKQRLQSPHPDPPPQAGEGEPAGDSP